MPLTLGNSPAGTAEEALDAEMEAAARAAPLSMMRAMEMARSHMAGISPQPIDGIASAERAGTGWTMVVEVVESPARMGDNDLLAAFQLDIGGDGDLAGFRRLRRYHREDREE